MTRVLPLQVEPSELARWSAEAVPPVVLDVREAWEVEICRLAGALHIPMGSLLMRADELPQDRAIVVMCHHGMRSLQVTQWLRGQGRQDVANLRGGIDAWAREIDPSMASY
jgi:rhodanese-related sulfurtransferase